MNFIQIFIEILCVQFVLIPDFYSIHVNPISDSRAIPRWYDSIENIQCALGLCLHRRKFWMNLDRQIFGWNGPVIWMTISMCILKRCAAYSAMCYEKWTPLLCCSFEIHDFYFYLFIYLFQMIVSQNTKQMNWFDGSSNGDCEQTYFDWNNENSHAEQHTLNRILNVSYYFNEKPQIITHETNTIFSC